MVSSEQQHIYAKHLDWLTYKITARNQIHINSVIWNSRYILVVGITNIFIFRLLAYRDITSRPSHLFEWFVVSSDRKETNCMCTCPAAPAGRLLTRSFTLLAQTCCLSACIDTPHAGQDTGLETAALSGKSKCVTPYYQNSCTIGKCTVTRLHVLSHFTNLS